MKNTWTRDHDILIARVAEGVEVVTCEEMCDAVTIHWKSTARRRFLDSGGDAWIRREDGEYVPVPSYFTDFLATARAGKAWCGQDTHARSWVLYGDGFFSRPSATFEDGQNHFDGEGESIENALAWALWRACGGVG